MKRSIQILKNPHNWGIQNQISKQYPSSEENMVKDTSNDMKNIVQLKSTPLIEWTMPIWWLLPCKLLISWLSQDHGMKWAVLPGLEWEWLLTAVEFQIKDPPYALTASAAPHALIAGKQYNSHRTGSAHQLPKAVKIFQHTVYRMGQLKKEEPCSHHVWDTKRASIP